MTAICDLLSKLTQELELISPSAKLDAELLVAHVLGLDRLELIARSTEQVLAASEQTIRELVARRTKHEPIAYLTGTKEFWGLEFKVTPDVLIPRPDSELLIELALEETNRHREPLDILDLGTGSGCLAISLANELSKNGRSCHIVAIDHSAAALRIAVINAKEHNVIGLVSFVQGDWVRAIDSAARFDIIISNPPYIAADDRNVSPETDFEPKAALYSENDGFFDIKQIIDTATQYLKPRGIVLCEMGSGQQKVVTDYVNSLTKTGKTLQLEIFKDLSGQDRVFSLVELGQKP